MGTGRWAQALVVGMKRCEGWDQPQVWGCQWLQRPSKTPNPISASWNPLTPSSKYLKTPQLLGMLLIEDGAVLVGAGVWGCAGGGR